MYGRIPIFITKIKGKIYLKRVIGFIKTVGLKQQ